MHALGADGLLLAMLGPAVATVSLGRFASQLYSGALWPGNNHKQLFPGHLCSWLGEQGPSLQRSDWMPTMLPYTKPTHHGAELRPCKHRGGAVGGVRPGGLVEQGLGHGLALPSGMGGASRLGGLLLLDWVPVGGLGSMVLATHSPCHVGGSSCTDLEEGGDNEGWRLDHQRRSWQAQA